VITRVFDAPRERVFRAWTEPARLLRWWAPTGFTTPFCTVDLRPGGVFRYCMRSPEGRDYWGRGVYREIVEPERIAYIDSFTDADGNPVPPSHYGMSSDFPSETSVTVVLAEHADRTTLSLQHSMGSASAAERDMCQQGWNQMLDALAAYLAGNGLKAQPRVGAKGEALAAQFEVKARKAVAVLEKLSDADWKKVTAAERWTVGVTAHHLASALEAVAGMVTTVASGQSVGDTFERRYGANFTMAVIDEMNAVHAKEHANCTRAETLALLEKGAAAAAAAVRGLSDEQLARSGTVFVDAPPMTLEQLVMGGLILHIDDHLGSIRQTVGC
jgi:uncharacterized protein YndB with AHSA1/START domain